VAANPCKSASPDTDPKNTPNSMIPREARSLKNMGRLQLTLLVLSVQARKTNSSYFLHELQVKRGNGLRKRVESDYNFSFYNMRSLPTPFPST